MMNVREDALLMISFLCKFRPRSVQAKYAASYKKAVVNAYKAYYAKDNAQFGADLYGIAYYFHKRPTELDADNLSKPIWDALENVLYENDRRIKLRYAGLFDIHQPGSVTVLDMNRIPLNVYDDFMKAIDSEDHLIYVEVGKISPRLYNMGVE